MLGHLDRFFDNRQLAMGFWLAVLFILLIFNKKVRGSIIGILKVMSGIKILIPILLMLIYIFWMVLIFSRIGFWQDALLGDTIIWIFGVGFALTINASRTNEEDFFKKAILDNIKILVIIEFLVNIYVFDLWVELILVPVLTLLGMLLAVSTTKDSNDQVETCLNYLLGIVGIGIIVFTIYNVIIDTEGFFTIANLKEFLLLIIFTITYLPFIYLFAVYIEYDNIFIHYNFRVTDARLRRYAKRKTLLIFHINLTWLKKWFQHCLKTVFQSKDELDREFDIVKSQL